MKTGFQQISGNPRYIKFVEWGKLIAITGGSQAIVQIAVLVSGIIIIRLLPTEEYALYTLANTMLATIIILADSGINIAVMSEGGKVWQDSKKLSIVLSTGLDLRRKFAVVSLLISTPILAYLLLHHGASKINTFAIIITIIPAFLAAMSDSIYEIAPKLFQDIKPLQKNQVSVSIARIFLSIVALLIAPLSSLVILAGAIPRIYGNIKLKKIASKRVSLNEHPNIEVRKSLLNIVKLSIPGLIYYCLSGQLNIWLISFFGQTKSIATIGAISRLTMGLSLFSSIFTMLIIPRFARLPNYKNIIRAYFIRLQLLLIAVVGIILVFTWAGSKELLWIIGPKYGGLHAELFLAMLSSCIILLLGSTYSLYSTKGWVMHPSHSISVSILATVLSLFLFNISTLKGVFYMNIFVASVEYTNCLFYTFIKINKISNSIN
ncbi:polysaccharide biosynthesis protein [Hymenobacter sp. BT186]|uniref:Polysaccharide biosynthesis protein n=1 Tax=Hymenobacter telluris TaxID=2816474 RepID=A0A939EUR5_9BACT|nr:polysaccharide biosynthesis protein [Hymenobacter telluris]MBO0357499.1 polysaccharide biosynthesis protein [Hymenobacter telluris]MBW3373525.1 polysaccharide biosynthesis protein [Hymenobacter norwichensis]